MWWRTPHKTHGCRASGLMRPVCAAPGVLRRSTERFGECWACIPRRRSPIPRKPTFKVALTQADRRLLHAILRAKHRPAQEIRRARVLLELDENHPGRARRGESTPTRAEIARRLGVSETTVGDIARAYVRRETNILATIQRRPADPPGRQRVTVEVQNALVELVNSKPPEGFNRWSLRLLERQVASRDDLPRLDHSTIGRALKRAGQRIA